jgi:transcriptional regulator with XRE-family HTH domain
MDSEEIRNLRLRLRYTQSRLAALVGVHALTVSRWERDDLIPPPDVQRILDAIFRALELVPELPDRLAHVGSDPIRELTLILAVLHPDLASQAMQLRGESEARALLVKPTLRTE